MAQKSVLLKDVLSDEIKNISLEKIKLADGVEITAANDKVVVTSAIETSPEGIHMGQQAQRISTTGTGIVVTNQNDKTHYSPVMLGIKDQSISENQDSTGIISPFYNEPNTPLFTLQQGTSAATSGQNTLYTSIDTLSDNGRIFGLSPIIADSIAPTDYIRYTVYEGTDQSAGAVFTQVLTGITRAADDYLAWDFEDYYEAPVGTVLNFQLTKSDGIMGTESVMSVRQSASDSSTYYVEVKLRGFVKQDIASKADLSALMGVYTTYVQADFTGTSDGSLLYPYSDIQEAIDNSADGSTFLLDGDFELTAGILLDPLKSHHFWGKEGTHVHFAGGYNTSNDSIFSHSSTTCTKDYTFIGIKMSESGEYALYPKSYNHLIMERCELTKNCFDATRLSLKNAQTDTWANGGVLGVDSSDADLLSHSSSVHASTAGGAARLRGGKSFVVRDCWIHHNFRALRPQDSGVNDGSGEISGCIIEHNMEAGIYCASSTYTSAAGCENINIFDNIVRYNGNNGILIIGGDKINFGRNVVYGNWNAGIMLWYAEGWNVPSGSITDNNRSAYKSMGGAGDGGDSANVYVYIDVDNLRSSIKYVGKMSVDIQRKDLSVSVDSVGIKVKTIGTSDTNRALATITLDSNDITGQDYGIDLSECNCDLVKVIMSNNKTINSQVSNVIDPTSGSYYELPFNNQRTNLNKADFALDPTGSSVSVYEVVVDGEESIATLIDTYSINQLQAVAFGSDIRILLADSNKIQFDDIPVSGCTISGVDVNSNQATAVNELNALFQASGALGNLPVITSSLAVSMTTGDTFNYELTATDAVGFEWDLSSVSGIVNVEGNSRKLIGGSAITAGTYNIPVKAINYYGEDSETIVLTVASSGAYDNVYAVDFHNNEYGTVDSIDDLHPLHSDGTTPTPWSIGGWLKPTSGNQASQTIFSFGASSTATSNGIISVNWRGGSAQSEITLKIEVPSASGEIKKITPSGSFQSAAYHHLLITYDGNPTSGATKFSSTKIYIDGVLQTTTDTSVNDGFSGAIPGAYLRFARKTNSAGYIRGGIMDEWAVWDSDESANIAAIYNSGTTHDLTLLASVPSSYYRFGDGDTFPNIVDNIGTYNIELKSMDVSDIVTDPA